MRMGQGKYGLLWCHVFPSDGSASRLAKCLCGGNGATCPSRTRFPASLPPPEVPESIAASSHSKSEVKEKTPPNKEIDPGAAMEFYNQTHIPDSSVLRKSPLKCKNLICQHVYIISSITVETVAGCGAAGPQTPGALKRDDGV